MKLSEFIKQAQSLAGDTDPELILYDRDRDETLVVHPDGDEFGFEIMRGDNEIVIEF